MRTYLLIIAGLLGASLSPLSAHATTVYTQTSSSADSGGNVVGSGGHVTTGNASAAASSYINVSGDDAGGTVDITITTSENGTTQTETRHVDVPADGAVSVSVATSSTGGGGSAPSSAQSASVVAQVERAAATTIEEVMPSAPASTSSGAGIAFAESNLLTLDSHELPRTLVMDLFSKAYESVRSLVAHIFAAISF